MAESSNKKLTLAEAIVNIQSDIKLFSTKSSHHVKMVKNGSTGKWEDKGFDYFNESDLYKAIKPAMEKNQIGYYFQKRGEVTIERFQTSNGNTMFTWGTNGLLTVFSKNDIEDKIVLEIYLTGTNTDTSKAMGTALTYSVRYWLSKLFGMATDELDQDSNLNDVETSKAKNKAVYNPVGVNDKQTAKIPQNEAKNEPKQAPTSIPSVNLANDTPANEKKALLQELRVLVMGKPEQNIMPNKDIQNEMNSILKSNGRTNPAELEIPELKMLIEMGGNNG